MEKQEREEFKRLQSVYGFEEGKNLERQGDSTLFRSVERGQMSAVDYHEKRIMLKVCEKNGVDDGSSASYGKRNKTYSRSFLNRILSSQILYPT